MKKIFEKAKLGTLELKNRLVRSATWEGIADRDGGIPEMAYEIYGELASGGVGAIITGFTSVQVHAAHFFFLSRFISPAVNHRKDGYGGSNESRARILIEILNGVGIPSASVLF